MNVSLTRVHALLAAIVLSHGSAVYAAAEDGRYAIEGAGLLSCENFVAEHGKRSGTYFVIVGWLDGYITGYNKFVSGTFDVTSFESSALVQSLIHEHCKQNPKHRLHAVLDALLVRLYPDRLTKASERVLIREGKRRTALYTDTIRRMQSELARRGMYRGDVDGRFTEETRAALAAFQSEIQLEATGFPDQQTLWRLLRRPAASEKG